MILKVCPTVTLTQYLKNAKYDSVGHSRAEYDPV